MTTSNDKETTGDRIAKVIARAGICSRRAAEKLVEEKRVYVNGKVLTSPAYNVQPNDEITIDGEPLPSSKQTQLWLYHKPKGLVTTHNDPQGRKTVFDNLPHGLPRVISVGRLDLNTEGLLLLTNDGALARYLEHPKTGWARRYRVRVYGMITKKLLKEFDDLKNGITIDGVTYGSITVTIEKKKPGEQETSKGHNSWITITLKEGKNREIRKVMEHFGLQVNRLIRVSYGPFQLGALMPGDAKQVTQKMLKEQLGNWQ